MSVQNVTKITIGLVLITFLAGAVPAQAQETAESNSCDYSRSYTVFQASTFSCPGYSQVVVTAEGLLWGSPAMTVCVSGVCQSVCGSFTIEGFEIVTVHMIGLKAGTGGACGSTIGRLTVSFT